MTSRNDIPGASRTTGRTLLAGREALARRPGRFAHGSFPGDRKGQGLVEFALVLPLLLFLLLGIAEFGRAWMTRNILTGASREAVRIAAVQGSASTALARANNILSSAGISGASVNIADDGAAYGTCTVTVSYSFPVTVACFLPGISGNSVLLSTSTSMRKEF